MSNSSIVLGIYCDSGRDCHRTRGSSRRKNEGKSGGCVQCVFRRGEFERVAVATAPLQNVVIRSSDACLPDTGSGAGEQNDQVFETTHTGSLSLPTRLRQFRRWRSLGCVRFCHLASADYTGTGTGMADGLESVGQTRCRIIAVVQRDPLLCENLREDGGHVGVGRGVVVRIAREAHRCQILLAAGKLIADVDEVH